MVPPACHAIWVWVSCRSVVIFALLALWRCLIYPGGSQMVLNACVKAMESALPVGELCSQSELFLYSQCKGNFRISGPNYQQIQEIPFKPWGNLLLWGGSNAGTGYPEWFLSLCPWIWSEPDWTWPWDTCCIWPSSVWHRRTKLSPEVPPSLCTSVLYATLWLFRLSQIKDLEFNSYCHVSKVISVMWQHFKLFCVQTYGVQFL